MSLPRIIVLLAVLASGVSPAAAAGEEPTQNLVAPFTCGTEWRGTTYNGHGANNWNLDINRTSRTYAPEDHDHDLGQPILSQGDGVVTWIAQDGYNSGAGAYVEVDYGDVTANYVHLVENSIPVEVGDEITTGDLLGLLGGSGNASHPHLHFGYWDSSGVENARRYQVSGNQIPVVIDGAEIVATPGNPSPSFVSTNCVDDYPFHDVSPSSFAYDDIRLLGELGITYGTSPTTFSPDLDVTREQMAAFIARLWTLLDDGATELPEELPMPFDDVDESSFAHDDIALLAHLEITTGSGDGTYAPDDKVTREQMGAFLARLWGLLDDGATELPDELDDPFDDVADESYAHHDILLLAHLLVTTGVGDGVYDPAGFVDREQMAAFLARLHRLFPEPEPEPV